MRYANDSSSWHKMVAFKTHGPLASYFNGMKMSRTKQNRSLVVLDVAKCKEFPNPYCVSSAIEMGTNESRVDTALLYDKS